MIILGLLLVALICLIVGLVLPSTAWLIASLIASVGAGYVLFRARTLIAGAHAVEGGGAKAAILEREPESAPDTPRRSRAQSRAEARAAKAAAAADEATEITEGTEATEGSDSAASDDTSVLAAQPDTSELDTSQFDTAQFDTAQFDTAQFDTSELDRAALGRPEDGTEVSGAELLAGVSGESDVDDREPNAEAGEGDVWVIDGRPRYHLSTCAIIQGQDAEPIPLEQAAEDGFMPCSLCEPNIVRTTTA